MRFAPAGLQNLVGIDGLLNGTGQICFAKSESRRWQDDD